MVIEMSPFVKSRMRRVGVLHFVGIGGVGMGGIAEVMHHLGFRVSGSDLGSNALTARLVGLGVDIKLGHAAEHAEDADVVVISTAVPEDNLPCWPSLCAFSKASRWLELTVRQQRRAWWQVC